MRKESVMESLMPIVWIGVAAALGTLILGSVILINFKWFPKNVYGTPKRLKRRTYPVDKPNPKLKTVVVRCFDKRFSTAHRDFLRKELKLRARDYFAPKGAGGPAALARRGQMEKKCDAIMEDIETAMDHFLIEQFVIIFHQDCRRYDKLVDRKTCDPHIERLDVLVAIQFLREKYPNVKVRGFYARFVATRWRKKRRIVFDEIFAEGAAQHAAA